jgi:hypothetical protein
MPTDPKADDNVGATAGPTPQGINIRLVPSARVALGYDTAASLHQQLGGLLQAARKTQTGA